jgi:hypothetical protein
MDVSERWGEVVEDAELEATPVVYHFRPTRYVRVSPRRLQEWERYFEANVGFPPTKGASSLRLDARSATMSGSHDSWDDADFV